MNKKTTKNRTKLMLKKPKDDKDLPKIIVDDQTTLEEIPKDVLEYKFSSKCALEWILKFYKESKNEIKKESCNDPKIRERFNTYRFADHKEHVIDLLQKVTTVSIETVKLRKELEKMHWGQQPKLDLQRFKGDKNTKFRTTAKLKPTKTRKSKTSKRTKKTTRHLTRLT